MQPRRSLLAAGAIATLIAQSLGAAAPAFAATSVPFASSGAEQTWVVPAGVTTIHVALIGGRGGGSGGFGADVEGDLGVTAGTTLYIEVAGNGTISGGGFNGGGRTTIASLGGYGGGGASDIRTIPSASPGSAGSRLIVAAGGGGHGGTVGLFGAGGDAGSAGGDGGGDAFGGGAGTVASGGVGGAGSSSLLNGGNGGITNGGAGGGGDISVRSGGGGGGGGSLGGGGGGGSQSTDGGGGGGGASDTGSATNASVSVDATGVPSITISYTSGPGPSPSPQDNGSVSAQFSVPTSAACIELSTSTIDFGSVRLGSENVPATPDITVTNCSGVSESIMAHGSDATASGTTWSLVGGSATCADSLGLDSYRMELESSSGTVGLSSSNAPLGSLAGSDTSIQTARMWAACPGSTGSGQLMTTQITFTAVEGG